MTMAETQLYVQYTRCQSKYPSPCLTREDDLRPRPDILGPETSLPNAIFCARVGACCFVFQSWWPSPSLREDRSLMIRS